MMVFSLFTWPSTGPTPLVSRVLDHASAQASTAHLLSILAEVKGLLDFLKIRDVHLLADRGCCDTDLIAWLRVCEWHYRIRIKSNLILAAPDGRTNRRLTLQGGPDPEPHSGRKRSDADPRTTLEVGWQLVFHLLS
ncbi:hypothetical protein [Deinococcus rubellus]|uniref:hypothetical protein n=1 Tax=Deinococcus rubellus TaxID=1889240 RepID=UPI0031EEDB88